MNRKTLFCSAWSSSLRASTTAIGAETAVAAIEILTTRFAKAQRYKLPLTRAPLQDRGTGGRAARLSFCSDAFGGAGGRSAVGAITVVPPVPFPTACKRL